MWVLVVLGWVFGIGFVLDFYLVIFTVVWWVFGVVLDVKVLYGLV